MKELIGRAISVLLLLGGVALIINGAFLLLGQDAFSLNKFTSAGRDSGGALLFIFGGAILVLYGSFNLRTNSN